MAEHKNPSLNEINEAIAREHGIDPATLKDYRLPDKADPDPRPLTPGQQAIVDAVPLMRAEDVPFGRPLLLRRPDPRVETGEGIPEWDNSGGEATRPDYLAQSRTPASVTPITSKSNNCFAWTPRQMLQEFIDAIDRGEEAPKGMVIVYSEELPDKGVHVHSWRSQVSWCEEYTFLEVAQQKCIDDKRR